MFTGIIHHTALVRSLTPTPTGQRLALTNPFPADIDPPRPGDSIAINGACLTLVSPPTDTLLFDAIPETLAKTNLASLRPQDRVHLERSLRVGDRIDGHFVQGHVDGTAELVSVSTAPLPKDVAPAEWASEWRATLRLPGQLTKYLIPKGSIAVDGVSLTIAAISGDTFDITLIPTTLALTALGHHPIGYLFNIECDPTVKTIVATLERMNLANAAR